MTCSSDSVREGKQLSFHRHDPPLPGHVWSVYRKTIRFTVLVVGLIVQVCQVGLFGVVAQRCQDHALVLHEVVLLRVQDGTTHARRQGRLVGLRPQ